MIFIIKEKMMNVIRKYFLQLFDRVHEIDEDEFQEYIELLPDLPNENAKEGLSEFLSEDEFEAAVIWMNRDKIPQA